MQAHRPTWKSALILLLLSNSIEVIGGEDSMDSVISPSGSTAEISYYSKEHQGELKLFWKRLGESSVQIIYNGFLQVPDKFDLDSEVQDNIRRTKLVIKNVTMEDAARVLCIDESESGKRSVRLTLLSVYLEKPKCRYVCEKDELLLICSFCYRSVNKLSTRWIIDGSEELHESHSKEDLDPIHNCVKHTSYGSPPHSCTSFSASTLSMAVYDTITNTTSIQYPLIETDSASRMLVSDTTGSNLVESSTLMSTVKNFARTASGNNTTVIVVIVILAIVLVVLLIAWILLLRRQCQKPNSDVENVNSIISIEPGTSSDFPEKCEQNECGSVRKSTQTSNRPTDHLLSAHLKEGAETSLMSRKPGMDDNFHSSQDDAQQESNESESTIHSVSPLLHTGR